MRILSLSEHLLTCLDSGQSVKLSCKYSPIFLRLLCASADSHQPLTMAMLSSTIRQEQASFKLHRNQVLRMLRDITKAFTDLQVGVEIHPEKHHRSTGPWYLSGAETVSLADSGQSSVIPPKQSRYFDWGDNWQAIPRQLYEFLSIMLTADVLTHEGYVQEAAKYLLACEKFPMKPHLRALVCSHRARLLAKSGDFKTAKALTIQVANDAEQRGDKQSARSARFFLDYLDYVEEPAVNYAMLLNSMTEPPAFSHADELSMMYWHNLRALLLRRQAIDNPEQALICHQQALCHFEEALFIAIRMNNTDRIMDFMVNTALHLQELLPLELTQLEDVYHWYYLAVNYTDKIGSGNHSAWDRIFFTEFYLKYSDEILASPMMQPILASVLSPHQLSFYQTTLKEIEKSGDARQKIIFLTLYIRFARKQCDNRLVADLILRAAKLLSNQSEHFVQALRQEGYGEDIERILNTGNANPPLPRETDEL